MMPNCRDNSRALCFSDNRAAACSALTCSRNAASWTINGGFSASISAGSVMIFGVLLACSVATGVNGSFNLGAGRGVGVGEMAGSFVSANGCSVSDAAEGCVSAPASAKVPVPILPSVSGVASGFGSGRCTGGNSGFASGRTSLSALLSGVLISSSICRTAVS